MHRRHGAQLFVFQMKRQLLVQGHIAHPIAIGEAEVRSGQVVAHLMQAGAGQTVFPRLHQTDFPIKHRIRVIAGLTASPGYHHARRMLGQTEEIVLDDIPLVAQTHHELPEAKGAVVLHDVKEDRLPAHRDHGLGNGLGLFHQPGPPPSSENDDRDVLGAKRVHIQLLFQSSRDAEAQSADPVSPANYSLREQYHLSKSQRQN